jgi:hypothetical protein
MLYPIIGQIVVPLPTTYQIDSVKKESVSAKAGFKKVVDRDFGGHGEKTTLVPTTQTITTQNLTGSAYSSMASDAIAGDETFQTSNVQITKLNQTALKGIA